MERIKTIEEFNKSSGFDCLLKLLSDIPEEDEDDTFLRIYAVRFDRMEILNLEKYSVEAIKSLWKEKNTLIFIVKC